MAAGRRRYGVVIDAAVFIVMEAAAVVLLLHTRSLQDIWLNRASHRTLAALWRGGESIRNYFSLDSQNKALTADNALLAAKLRESEGEGQQSAVPSQTIGRFRYTPATIVKASRNSQHNYIILDKGSADGIRPQSGIISSKGVVGVVNIVDEHYSYGITMMNPMLSVSARIGRDGTVAPLVWDGMRSDGAVIRNLPLHLPLEKGDTVWTSGYSSMFPADVPLGITGKVRMVDGSMNEVEVQLFQDLGALRYVTVTENLSRDQISGLEEEAGR